MPSTHQDDDLPPNQGMSTVAKVLLTLLVVGGIVAVACCGGSIFMGFLGYRSVQTAWNYNPTVVTVAQRQIVSITVPLEFDARETSENAEVILVRYVHEDAPQATIGLAKRMATAIPLAEDDQKQRLESQLRPFMKLPTDLQATTSEIKDLEINGQTISVQFNQLKNKDETIREIVAFVPMEDGILLVLVSVPEAFYDEESLISMLESIREPAKKNEQAGSLDEASTDGAMSEAASGPFRATQSEKPDNFTDQVPPSDQSSKPAPDSTPEPNSQDTSEPANKPAERPEEPPSVQQNN